jgi:hypothetical protein
MGMPGKRPPSEAREVVIETCPERSAIFSGARVCPECGYIFVPQGKLIIANSGELIALNARKLIEGQETKLQ